MVDDEICPNCHQNIYDTPSCYPVNAASVSPGPPYIAHNKCMKCKMQWHDEPGPHTECPKCGSIYVEWMNYPIERPLYCRICDLELITR